MRFRFLAAAFFALSTLSLAQSDSQKSSETQQAFKQMKSLAGSWEGKVSTLPVTPAIDGKQMQVTLRVTSMGNALMHEITGAGRPDDPITMLYVDEDHLMLTHFCDAGNRPRMTGKVSPDGKTIEFEFLDVTGDMKYGHMHHAIFTFIDADHHTEDWTFGMGEKSVRAHFELQRVYPLRQFHLPNRLFSECRLSAPSKARLTPSHTWLKQIF